jgi:hypothetical protein
MTQNQQMSLPQHWSSSILVVLNIGLPEAEPVSVTDRYSFFNKLYDRVYRMDSNPLKVTVFSTNKSKVSSRPLHDSHTVPKHPFRAILSGASGSGKTNLLLWLLTKDIIYKDFFDVIIILSPTAGKLDDSYAALAKSNSKSVIRIINDITEDVIKTIMSTNKKIILEKKVHKSPKLLLIYDDIISNKKLMNTKAFLHSFVASRHYNASVIICTQKYNAVPRTCRLQANAVFYFRGSNSEREVLAIEFSPSGYNKKEMISIIDHCTNEPYSFLFWNGQAGRGKQIRCGVDTILTLTK